MLLCKCPHAGQAHSVQLIICNSSSSSCYNTAKDTAVTTTVDTAAAVQTAADAVFANSNICSSSSCYGQIGWLVTCMGTGAAATAARVSAVCATVSASPFFFFFLGSASAAAPLVSASASLFFFCREVTQSSHSVIRKPEPLVSLIRTMCWCEETWQASWLV